MIKKEAKQRFSVIFFASFIFWVVYHALLLSKYGGDFVLKLIGSFLSAVIGGSITSFITLIVAYALIIEIGEIFSSKIALIIIALICSLSCLHWIDHKNGLFYFISITITIVAIIFIYAIEYLCRKFTNVSEENTNGVLKKWHSVFTPCFIYCLFFMVLYTKKWIGLIFVPIVSVVVSVFISAIVFFLFYQILKILNLDKEETKSKIVLAVLILIALFFCILLSILILYIKS